MKSTGVGFWFLAILLVSVTSMHSQTKISNMASDLAGTSWRLVKFQGSDGTTLMPDDKGRYAITFEADGHVSARIDCNRPCVLPAGIAARSNCQTVAERAVLHAEGWASLLGADGRRRYLRVRAIELFWEYRRNR